MGLHWTLRGKIGYRAEIKENRSIGEFVSQMYSTEDLVPE
jgi:hypothetical protein